MGMESETTNELQSLRRCNRDLLALSALPVLWTNSFTYKQIAESFTSVLLDTLQLDAVFLFLKIPGKEGSIQIVQLNQEIIPPDQAEEWISLFSPLLKLPYLTSQLFSVPAQLGGQGQLNTINIPLGYDGTHGVLIAASKRVNFPSQTEHLLLNFSTNQIAVVLERRKTEEQIRETEARYRLVTLATNDTIWDWNLLTENIHWNKGLETLFGYQADKGSFGARWRHEHIHENDRKRVVDRIYRLIKEKESYWSDEYRFLKQDGSYAVIFDRGYIVRDEHGKATRMIGAMLDVTERKNTEESKEKALKEAKIALKARDEFVSIASHELKTPLNSLYLQLQMLSRTLQREKVDTAVENGVNLISAEKIVKSVKICEKQTKKLAALVDELLDLTSIRAGKLELRPQKVNLTVVVKEVIERFQEEANKKEITFKLSSGETKAEGLWDLIRIEQVITNLISNAIKYGEGQPIEIRVTKDENHHQIILEIKDGGRGIPLNLQNIIFERFERGMENQQISGLGLGLYITHKIVEAHGGTIQVESAVGCGATFAVVLPMRPKSTVMSDKNTIEQLIKI